MEYMCISGLENDQVRELKQEINNLRARISIQEERLANTRGGNILKTQSIDFYPGEQLDFILSILSQAREKCPPQSRPRDILDSILSVNRPVGRGQEILNEINRIFRKGLPSGDADIAALQAIGFSFTPSRKHPKLRFHDKYVFILPSTPSDRRSNMNSLSEINKCIAVNQKI